MASSKVDSIEITREMIEAVALAQLYRDDPVVALRTVAAGYKLTARELDDLYRKVLTSKDYAKIKEETLEIEKSTLVDDDIDTVMLQYNRLLEEAREEKKYEVAARILKEIKQLKAIEDDENKFEITFVIEHKNVGDSKDD